MTYTFGDMNDLLSAAELARSNAHCPYSEYAVGAALRSEDGRVFAGCNVENVSYGLAICAERAAICAMVAAGGRRIAELLVLTRDGGVPCGACLQVIAEFAGDDLPIHVVAAGGEVSTYRLAALNPYPFRF